MHVCVDLDLHFRCEKYRTIRDLALSAGQISDSAKFRCLSRLLPTMRAEGHRVLIFSGWTRVLDALELLLSQLGLHFRRLDGSTPQAITHARPSCYSRAAAKPQRSRAQDERQALIDEYNSDTDIFAFILSTRAGGLGINLTGADTVVIHDVDFNPAADKQAMDRCHRMGQTRPVRVIKLATAGTVDEKVLQARGDTPEIGVRPSRDATEM